MTFAAGTIFISYSRSDGRDFAETFEQRLKAEGIHAWRDLKDMGAGDVRPQVLRAIEGATQLVLILSRRALASEWIKREWSHARLHGKRVSPVLADPTLTRADLPAWMRREEVFDIDPVRDRDRRSAGSPSCSVCEATDAPSAHPTCKAICPPISSPGPRNTSH